MFRILIVCRVPFITFRKITCLSLKKERSGLYIWLCPSICHPFRPSVTTVSYRLSLVIFWCKVGVSRCVWLQRFLFTCFRQLLIDCGGPDAEAVKVYFSLQGQEQAVATALVLATSQAIVDRQVSQQAFAAPTD